MGADEVLEGCVIASFSIITLSIISYYCINKYKSRAISMRKSPSMEDLNQDDPVMV